MSRETPSLWLPEPNVPLLLIVGKLGEESAELSKACFRAIIQGIDGIDPENGKTNKQALLEEMADVRGLTRATLGRLSLAGYELETRAQYKQQHKERWLEMVDNYFGVSK